MASTVMSAASVAAVTPDGACTLLFFLLAHQTMATTLFVLCLSWCTRRACQGRRRPRMLCLPLGGRSSSLCALLVTSIRNVAGGDQLSGRRCRLDTGCHDGDFGGGRPPQLRHPSPPSAARTSCPRTARKSNRDDHMRMVNGAATTATVVTTRPQPPSPRSPPPPPQPLFLRILPCARGCGSGCVATRPPLMQ